ncbi:MAG: sulfotransferase [Bacteroidota bacterium]
MKRQNHQFSPRTKQLSKLKKASVPPLRMLSKMGNFLHPARNNNPLIISGSPRSGTTWVAETIAEIYRSRRILWEPLQESNIDKKGFGFSKRPYIDESSAQTKIDDFFSSLLQAKQANPHLLRLRKYPLKQLFSLLQNQNLIIKFVRGNGVVGYLRRRFSIPVPLIIVRHPCAVIASQLNMGRWEDHPYIDNEFLRKKPTIQEHINYHAPLAQRLAMTWACDVLAAKENKENLHIVYYEDIVTNGPETLLPVFQSWGWSDTPKKLEKLLGRFSSTTHKWSSLDSNENKLTRWMKELDAGTIEEILRTVHSFGVSDYIDDPLPVMK